MSIKLLSEVWDYDVTGVRRDVLQVLCDYANDDGYCWPGMRRIAWKVGCSKRTVVTTLQWLESMGAVEVLERGVGRGHSNQYRVRLDALETKEPFTEDFDPDSRKGVKGEIPSSNGEIPALKGEVAASPEPSVPEPSKTEPSLGAKKERSPKRRSAIPDDWVPDDAGKDFAAAHGMNAMDAITEMHRFINHHQAKGSLMVDWSAAWRTWVLNAEKWRGERGVRKSPAQLNRGGTGKVVV